MLLRRQATPALKQEQRVVAQVGARPSGLCSTLTIWRLGLGLLLPFTLALGYCSQIWVSKFMQATPVTVIESVQSSTAMVTSESNSRRVAVCFFGLTRSLNHTIASIKENVIGPLVQQGYEADVFVHTYNDIRHLINTRTGEDTDLDTEQWRLLQPYDVSLTSQEDFLQPPANAIESVWNSFRGCTCLDDLAHSAPMLRHHLLCSRKMRRCLQRGTGWPREALDVQVSNVRNLLAQLNSVLQVGKLWERKHSERKYSAVLFARPDVNFTCPFPADMLESLQDDTVYAPDFALWRGINDRFALLRPAAAAVWKRRVFFSLHACRFRPIHAEIFASDFAAATGLSYLPIKRFGFVRMRSTGVVAALDETYPDLCAGGAASRHA